MLNEIQSSQILLLMDGILFVLGLITFLTGVGILTSRALGKEVRTLATSTSKLAQKGIAEDVAGLVGNASALMNALQQMVNTAAGVGVFLVLVGMILMSSSCYIFLKAFQNTIF